MKQWFCILVTLAGLAAAQDKPGVSELPPSSPVNLELTVYLVSGFGQPQAPAKDEVPQELAATMQQLHGVFAYKSYKLLEAVTLRGRNFRGSEVAGELPDGKYYDFRYVRARISTETPRMVHLDSLRLEISSNRFKKDQVALVSTDLDIREGQKTVVGKSAVAGTGDALFLVIVPKVLE